MNFREIVRYTALSIVAIFGLLFILSSAHADTKRWGNDLHQINETIRNTNFVVEDHCSGTLISNELRLVLTNFHCIDDNVTQKTDPVVWQTRNDEFQPLGRDQFVTKIVAMSKAKDVAVLQILDPHFKSGPASKLSTTAVRGEDVWIIGNPGMLEASVVKGILSNRNRTLKVGGLEEPQNYLQFSGGIIGGQSGGALYNEWGQLIAITSAVRPNATFLGFGIPAQTAIDVMKDACIGWEDQRFVETTKCPGSKSLLRK